MALSIRELAAQRLKKSQSSGGGNIDYAKLKFKPEIGKEYQIRILPNKYSEYPIQELEIHKYDTFKKSPIALTSFGEPDPIVKFIKSLWDEVNKAKASNDPNLAVITKENGDIAKAMKPGKRFFAQVIVRGDEAKGPIIWEFGSTIASQIDSFLASEDYENLTGIQDGTDIVVTGIEASMKSGQKYTDVSITPRKKESPISKDPDTVEKWLEDQKDPAQVLYKKMTYDELKKMLKDYLNPGDGDDEKEEQPKKKPLPLKPAKAPVKKVEVEEQDEDEEEDTPPPPPVKKPIKKTIELEPEDEDEEPEEEEETDDLPFKAPAKSSKASSSKVPKEYVEEEDELQDKIPSVKGSAKAEIKTKAPVTKKAITPTSTKKSFEDVFDEDEDDE